MSRPQPRTSEALALIAVRAMLESIRDTFGSKQCRKFMLSMRSRSGMVMPSNVMSMYPEERDQNDWARWLAGHCKTCQQCRLGRGREARP